jgi:hypothetical protein
VTPAAGVVAAVVAVQAPGAAAFPGSTRAAGLAGAGAALVGDAGAIFANPAALATVSRLAFDASYQRATASDTVFYAAAVATRLPRLDWGAGVEALAPSAAARLAAADLLAASALVFRTGLLALGVAAKYARQTIGGVPDHAWAGDAGVAIAVFDILALGASVQNIGGDFGGGVHLPRRTRAGFTMNYVDPQGTVRLLTTLEGQWPDRGSAFLVVGVEGGVVAHGVGLLARVGYAGHSAATSASPFALGGSVALGPLDVDYAYRGGTGGTGATHRVGLRWRP